MILATILGLATAPRPEKLSMGYEPKEGDRNLGPATDAQMALAAVLGQHTQSTNKKIVNFNQNCERRLWVPGSREFMEADQDIERATKENRALQDVFWQELDQEFLHDPKTETLGIANDGSVYATPRSTGDLFETLSPGTVVISIGGRLVGLQGL